MSKARAFSLHRLALMTREQRGWRFAMAVSNAWIEPTSTSQTTAVRDALILQALLRRHQPTTRYANFAQPVRNKVRV